MHQDHYPLNVGKLIAPKGLFLTRPSIAHYTATREELDEAAINFLKW